MSVTMSEARSEVNSKSVSPADAFDLAIKLPIFSFDRRVAWSVGAGNGGTAGGAR
jgi:hypothetical protein